MLPVPTDEQCTLDTVAPVIQTDQLVPAPAEFINNATPLITGVYNDLYSDIDPDSVRLLVDGVDVTDQAVVDLTNVQYTPTTDLAEGSHDVTIEVSDEWGYAADPFSWTFTVDLTAPIVTITTPIDGHYLYPALVTVRWSVDETNPADVILSLNSNPQSLGPNAVEADVNLASGINVIEVTVLDQAGNSTSATIQVTLDTDTDGDGIGDYYDTDDDNDLMPDSWEVDNGFDPLDPLDAPLDADGDGHANLTEYTAGTDPRNPASYPIDSLAVDHITVTDVTAEGFSVIWQVTKPSTCSLEIYDEMGVLLSNLDIVSESALHPPAEDIGVMKVSVSGLAANTTYYFQVKTTAKANGLVLLTPLYPEMLEVVTESADAIVVNDSIKQMIYDENGIPADGALLVASVTGGDYPVTAWVGQDLVSPWGRVDLNRIYSESTHENLQLLGGEELTLWSFGGQLGNYLNIQKVPLPIGGEQTALRTAAYLSELYLKVVFKGKGGVSTGRLLAAVNRPH